MGEASDTRATDLHRKLAVEEKLLDGALQMKASLTDRNALAQCDASLADSAKRIAYLRTQLNNLSVSSSEPSKPTVSDSSNRLPVPVAMAFPVVLSHSSSNDSLLINYSQSNPFPDSNHSESNLSATGMPGQSDRAGSSFSGGLFSYLKKSIRSRSSTQVSAIEGSSMPTNMSSSSSLPPSSDPRVVLAQSLPADVSTIFLDGPPPIGSVPIPPDLVHSTNTRDSAISNLDASRASIMLSTSIISCKMRDLTYMLDRASKIVNSGLVPSSSESLPTMPNSALAKHGSLTPSVRPNTPTDQMDIPALMDALKRALNKYSGLYVPEPADDVPRSPPENGPPPMVTTIPRHQQQSDLTVHIVAIRVPPSVKNALSRSFADHYVALVLVDGTIKARSRAFKSPKDKTGCETEIPFNFSVTVPGLNNSAHIEVILIEADKHGATKMVDGLLWFSIDNLSKSNMNITNAPNYVPDSPTISTSGVLGWFDMDPVGVILLQAVITPVSARTRKISRLGRQGALRKKNKVEATKNGHQFILAQAASIVKCALCSEFIGVSSCYNCEACGFSCHKKCASKVLTRCISVAVDPSEVNDDEILPHDIHHRFLSWLNLKAQWCCHCGHLVQLGRGSLKCTECDLIAHKGCSALVPNFCGLSMKRANKMLHEIKLAKDLREKAKFINLHHKDTDVSKTLIPSLSASPVPHSDLKPHDGNSSSIGSFTNSPNGSYNASPQKAPPATSESIHPAITHTAKTPSVSLDNFLFLAVLGKGNFGKVMLAEDRVSRKLYAIKVLKKGFVLENDEVESTRSEKRIFQSANESRHPFLINLYATLQTESRLYFVMEYVAGGDLMLHIQRQQFGEPRAKFYACEVLLSLQFFHMNNIVYRDLKLDNIMLAMDGHIKLADYGLCKENMPLGATTNTFCGTPEFMAPEILSEQNYSRAVDWWAFGVLVYEMLCGQSPFRGENEEEIFESILNDEVLYPVNMSRDAVHLCQGLLTKNPIHRLGAGVADAEEIMYHPFFRGVDWNALLCKSISPPFVPAISAATDVCNFDEEFTREPPVLTPIQTLLDDADQQEFVGFTYVADWVNAVN